MENPEAYVSLMNNYFSQQGIPPIFIPASDLSDSRKLFLVKSTLNPLASNTITKPPPTTQSPVSHNSSTVPTNLSIQQPNSQSPVSSTSSQSFLIKLPHPPLFISALHLLLQPFHLVLYPPFTAPPNLSLLQSFPTSHHSHFYPTHLPTAHLLPPTL